MKNPFRKIAAEVDKIKNDPFDAEAQKKRMVEWAKAMADKVYVVEMLRYGDRETHSYVIGAYHTEKAALKAAKDHMDFRGGKYSAEITGYWRETERFYWQKIDWEDCVYERSLKEKK